MTSGLFAPNTPKLYSGLLIPTVLWLCSPLRRTSAHDTTGSSSDGEVAIGTEYLSDFKKFAKDNYALSTDNSSKYKKWHKSSYLLRNSYIHKQAVPQGPRQSDAAIQSTIDLMIESN